MFRLREFLVVVCVGENYRCDKNNSLSDEKHKNFTHTTTLTVRSYIENTWLMKEKILIYFYKDETKPKQ